jgi:hypothetical protein
MALLLTFIICIINELTMALIKAKMDEQRINELKVEYVRDLFEIPSLDLCKMIAIDDGKLRNGGDFRNVDHENLAYQSHLKKLFRVYKYVDFEGFTKLLKDGFLFKEPRLWEDPYEKLFYRTTSEKYHGVPDKDFPVLYSCCTTSNKEEPASAWKMYVKNGGLASKCVKLTIDIIPFLELLNTFSKYHNCTTYYGAATYLYNKDDIDTFYTGRKNKYLRFGSFSLANYLSLMLIKRPPFNTEKEIRFFIAPNSGSLSKDGFINVGGTPTLNRIIKRVVLDPWCEEADLLYIRSICSNIGLDCDIHINNLLDGNEVKYFTYSIENIPNPWENSH